MSDPKNPLLIQYGDFALDFAKMPEASLVAMLRRGVSHYFGSEQASKVTAIFKKEGDDAVVDTPEARAKYKGEFQAKANDALLAGTVGVSTRGPTLDPIEKIITRLAKAEVTKVLKQNGVKFPTKAEDTVEVPGGEKYTGLELIARRIDRDGDRLQTEAKKVMAEQARKAKKETEAAEGQDLTSL